MQTSAFFEKQQLELINIKVDVFIEKMNDEFGYNDGEPLDEDGIEFVIQLMKHKWWLANAVCEE